MLQTLAAVVVLAGGLAAGYAFGQAPGGPPDPQAMAEMRVNALASQLSLTDTQKSAANLRANRDSMVKAVKKNEPARYRVN